MKRTAPRRLARSTICGLALMTLATPLASADCEHRRPFPHHREPYRLSSGVVENKAARPRVLFDQTVLAPPGTPWMRIHFGECRLGPKTFLEITSLQDGATQRLDVDSLRQWRSSSAYFNGDAVRVTMHAAAGASAAAVEITEITVGERLGDRIPPHHDLPQPAAAKSLCSGSDDRVPSSDPAVGRIMPTGCTGWIVSNRANLTAGHCVDENADTLQFNVPQSLSDGTPVNPPPEDQYPIEPEATIISMQLGIGSDWAVFKTYVNSNTGLHAVHAQGAFYRMTRDLTPATVIVTGYGLDWSPPGTDPNNCDVFNMHSCNSASQTQQTDTGSYLPETVVDPERVIIEYTVDTTPASSGSPVIALPVGDWPPLTMGIHTNAGCDPPDEGNQGTGFEHDNLELAIKAFLGWINVVYVDGGHYDLVSEDGSVFRPYDTFAEGVTDASDNPPTPLLAVVAGTYDDVTSTPLIIDDPMRIKAPVGNVLIE